jgi:hypothetical protein
MARSAERTVWTFVISAAATLLCGDCVVGVFVVAVLVAAPFDFAFIVSFLGKTRRSRKFARGQQSHLPTTAGNFWVLLF